MEHLKEEGKAESGIFHVGHVMIDNLYFEIERLNQDRHGLEKSTSLKENKARYGVVTLHRPSNVDDDGVFRAIIDALSQISVDLPLIFPVHPRTQARIDKFNIRLPKTITTTDPMGYREFLDLWRGAVLVLTDSGGLQEETTGLGVPCLTLRENTERPVTVSEGSNRLVGVDAAVIVREARAIINSTGTRSDGAKPKYWDGKASERILSALRDVLSY